MYSSSQDDDSGAVKKVGVRVRTEVSRDSIRSDNQIEVYESTRLSQKVRQYRIVTVILDAGCWMPSSAPTLARSQAL